MGPQLPADVQTLLEQLRIFLWVFGIALLPMLGWAIQLTFSLRQNKTDHAAMELALANLKEGQETLEKEVSAMGIIVGKNDDRVDGLTQVIRDNTHAMNKLVTLIEVMNERLRKD